MKYIVLCLAIVSMAFIPAGMQGQDQPVTPSITGTGVFLGVTPPLRDLPVLTEEEFQAMLEDAHKERNEELEERSYPYAETALPKGPDEVWQRTMGSNRSATDILLSFDGQTSPYYPPDCNGTAGPNHYMQTINTVYAIYDKDDGSLLAGPTAMNQLFSGVPGSNCNDGDPLILYDETADRWLAVEFSLCGSNDRMLIAVSQTNDPTGSWYAYSFDVADMPDYEKFGIWQDGYYMGTNNTSGNDIYVFERDQMLTGGTAQFVGFNNPWRPTTIDGFHCVPPVDNDGSFAPAGSPGLFITINDDAIGGGSDQLWIYELDVDWANLSNSTFDRVQQLDVPPFDSNFGNTWNNISQPGTNQKLDAIPMVIMNRPQYRNFGSYQTIVCCHTVDVDATNHAGIRWYELRRTTGDWSIRQSGTYAPDAHSRWMGSIALNGNDEIALGYSISSTSEYPGIRYTGQSEAEYAAASGVLDLAETVIHTGANSQSGANRWGDYSNMAVDPVNDHTFWFTTQYVGPGGSRKTRIASFELSPFGLSALFSSSATSLCEGGQVTFHDQSSGTPVYWEWVFEGGDPDTSYLQDPLVNYLAPGDYDVQLVISDGLGYDTLLQADYIHVNPPPVSPAQPTGATLLCQGDGGVPYTAVAVPEALFYSWSVFPPEAGSISGSGLTGTLSLDETFLGTLYVKVSAIGLCGTSEPSDSLQVEVEPGPAIFNLSEGGGYCTGNQGIEITLDGSETAVDYELYLDGSATGNTVAGTGLPISFGTLADTGLYTCLAYGGDCEVSMTGTAHVYMVDVVGSAATPSGPSEVCSTDSGTEYTTEGAENADVYFWYVSPAEAGSILGGTTTATVEWSPAYSGLAGITVQGYNDCGQGPMSDPFEVTVNLAPAPGIIGEQDVCGGDMGQIYYTASTPGSDYSWEITGGEIVSGNGTAEVMVNWGDPGNGSLMVMESSAAGCVGISEEFQVTINDCTGLGELKGQAVELYPNPVEDLLTVRCSIQDKGPVTLNILSPGGQVVYSRRIGVSGGVMNATVSTAGFASGVYTVKVITPGGDLMEGKFVKAD